MSKIDALVVLEEGVQDWMDAVKIVAKAASEAGVSDPDRFATAVLARLAHADILAVRCREVKPEELRQMLAEHDAEPEWKSPEDGLEWKK